MLVDKRAEVGLTYVYGIGPSTSREILKEVGVDPDTYIKDLTEEKESHGVMGLSDWESLRLPK